MEPTIGQRFMAGFVDVTFFIVIGVLGWHGVLKESIIFALLVIYAQGRFGVAKDKQTSMLVQASTGTSSGASGQMRAVRPPEERARPRDEDPPGPGEAPVGPHHASRTTPIHHGRSTGKPPIPREERGILKFLRDLRASVPIFSLFVVLVVMVLLR